MRSEDIHESLGQVVVTELIMERQKQWKEKLGGMYVDRLVKKFYEGDGIRRRPRGRLGGRDGKIILGMIRI